MKKTWKVLDYLFGRLGVLRVDNPLSIVGDGWAHYVSVLHWWSIPYFKFRIHYGSARSERI